MKQYKKQREEEFENIKMILDNHLRFTYSEDLELELLRYFEKKISQTAKKVLEEVLEVVKKDEDFIREWSAVNMGNTKETMEAGFEKYRKLKEGAGERIKQSLQSKIKEYE